MKERLQKADAAHREALARASKAEDRVKQVESAKTAAERQAAKAVRINDLEATREALRARADLTPAEQHRVTEHLSRAANASILRGCDNPQQAIAAGLIASGTRSAKEATKGMEKSSCAKVADAVSHNQENEQRRERQRTREQTHDFGLDFGLSR